MGKWTKYYGVNVSAFHGAVKDILKEYGDVVYQATEEGLTAAEKVLIRNLKENTPVDTGNFKKNWKGKGRKYRLRRFVGNTTTVKGAKGEQISLANIFEYSTTKGKPFIKRTFNGCVNEMAEACVNEMKKFK